MALNHVEPGGAPVVDELGSVTITKFSVGDMDNNVYLVGDDTAVVLIDAADDPERIREVLDGRRVTAIVTTHRHRDHLRALADIARDTGAPVHAGTPDLDAIADQTRVRPQAVWTGDTIPLPTGDAFDVVGLVGHTPGSIMLVLRPEGRPVQLFTGDSLFPGGPGRTQSARQFTSLLSDLETKVFDPWPDDAVVHPGHGDDTTLGAERPHLAEWRERGW